MHDAKYGPVYAGLVELLACNLPCRRIVQPNVTPAAERASQIRAGVEGYEDGAGSDCGVRRPSQRLPRLGIVVAMNPASLHPAPTMARPHDDQPDGAARRGPGADKLLPSPWVDRE